MTSAPRGKSRWQVTAAVPVPTPGAGSASGRGWSGEDDGGPTPGTVPLWGHGGQQSGTAPSDELVVAPQGKLVMYTNMIHASYFHILVHSH